MRARQRAALRTGIDGLAPTIGDRRRSCADASCSGSSDGAARWMLPRRPDAPHTKLNLMLYSSGRLLDVTLRVLHLLVTRRAYCTHPCIIHRGGSWRGAEQMQANQGRPVGDGSSAVASECRDDKQEDTQRAIAQDAWVQAVEAYAWAWERHAWAQDLRAEIADIREQTAVAQRRALLARMQGLDMYVAAVEAWIRTDEVRALAEAAGVRARVARTRSG
jgi:hypothetical protein